MSPPPRLSLQLAADAARQAITLLKNGPRGSPGSLPWSAQALSGKRVCVLGPLANLSLAHMGSYAPTVPFEDIASPAAGLASALTGVGATVVTLAGCTDQTACSQIDPALGPLAATCDAIVAVLGTSAISTEDEGLVEPSMLRRSRARAAAAACDPTQNAHEQEGCDRANVLLPGQQLALLSMLSAAANVSGAPLLLVAVSAGMLDLSVPAADPAVAAILRAPYLAQFVGRALADVILGGFNPSGRLTLTFYAPPYSNNLPAISNYSMAGRTYRYYSGKPLFEFGYGLSFTNWEYANVTLPSSVGPCDITFISAVLTNTGNLSGAEVAQLYLSIANASVPLVPLKQLVNFQKQILGPGDSILLNLTITPEDNAVLRDGDFVPVIEPGLRSVWLGSSSGEERPGVSTTFTVTGPVTLLSSCTANRALFRGASSDARSSSVTPARRSPAHVWPKPQLNSEGSGGAARWLP